MEEPGRLQSMRSLRVKQDWATSLSLSNGNPLQCSCLENPRDQGAWWAAVSGVGQSSTRLKRLSSSSSIHTFIEYILYFLEIFKNVCINIKKSYPQIHMAKLSIKFATLHSIYKIWNIKKYNKSLRVDKFRNHYKNALFFIFLDCEFLKYAVLCNLKYRHFWKSVTWSLQQDCYQVIWVS